MIAFQHRPIGDEENGLTELVVVGEPELVELFNGLSTPDQHAVIELAGSRSVRGDGSRYPKYSQPYIDDLVRHLAARSLPLPRLVRDVFPLIEAARFDNADDASAAQMWTERAQDHGIYPE